jgi:pyruvate kinase
MFENYVIEHKNKKLFTLKSKKGEKLDNNGMENTKESRRAYYMAAIRKMLDQKMLDMKDRVAYLGGSLGETGGTTYLDINEVWKVLEANEKYNLPDYTQ